jgi:hypothetical protein
MKSSHTWLLVIFQGTLLKYIQVDNTIEHLHIFVNSFGGFEEEFLRGLKQSLFFFGVQAA